MKKRVFFTILSLLALSFAPTAASPPKLVVNIVVSQMRYDYITRFQHNFGPGGIRRFLDDGLVYTDARYNYMQTTTPAGLATLTTGADPSMHGVVSERWIDYTNNNIVTLTGCTSARGLDCDLGTNNYSPRNLTAPTLGDRLRQENSYSKVVTIAADPVSAVVMGGFDSRTFWLDTDHGKWISSTAYMDALPWWLTGYNNQKPLDPFLDFRWSEAKRSGGYANNSSTILGAANQSPQRNGQRKAGRGGMDYSPILYTPAGNTIVTEMARQAIVGEELGKDEHTDLLNICFDASRFVSRRYGSESREAEDMIYHLDHEIAALLDFIYLNTEPEKVVVILTSDHGASDSFNHNGREKDRFNPAHFKVIMNGFMNAQYGPGDWVLDYCDRQLYFNRDLIYRNGFNLEDVQNRVAAFALQFRGVSHVLTSTALQMSAFHGGYAEKMQNSFYPRRSGDLTINLMPGWIEEADGARSLPGSMYEYDTHVPLMILAQRFYREKVFRQVDMRDLAPSLARIMGISRPLAAEGDAFDEVKKVY